MPVDSSGMTPDDQRYWDAVEAWKAKRLHSTPRELVPASWRAAVSRASSKTREGAGTAAQKIPNADKFAELLSQALRGLTDAGARAGAASVRTKAVLEGYRKRDFPVEELADIRKLECKDVQKVKPRLDIAYIAGSAAQGAGTGFLASGATTLAAVGAVGTGGVAAAPGVGVVVSAMAADAAANIVATNRAVAHIAAYYGYDVDDPAERIYALGVMNLGLAGDAGKLVAYRELNNIVQQLARQQAWKQLNKNGVARIVGAVYKVFGMSITKKKLAMAVPVVGVAIGAGLNARTLARVVDDAEHTYMERFLREKYGLPLIDDEGTADGELIDIIDAEIVEEIRVQDSALVRTTRFADGHEEILTADAIGLAESLATSRSLRDLSSGTITSYRVDASTLEPVQLVSLLRVVGTDAEDPEPWPEDVSEKWSTGDDELAEQIGDVTWVPRWIEVNDRRVSTVKADDGTLIPVLPDEDGLRVEVSSPLAEYSWSSSGGGRPLESNGGASTGLLREGIVYERQWGDIANDHSVRAVGNSPRDLGAAVADWALNAEIDQAVALALEPLDPESVLAAGERLELRTAIEQYSSGLWIDPELAAGVRERLSERDEHYRRTRTALTQPMSADGKALTAAIRAVAQGDEEVSTLTFATWMP